MALSNPRTLFGIHSVTPYRRSTGEPYGTIKVLQGSSLSVTGENIELYGGSNKWPWTSQIGQMNAEMSLKFNQYDNFILELFLGTAPTDNAAEATGYVSTLVNKSGTVVVSTGLASIAAKAGSESSLKFGKYLIKVVSGTTVDVYLLTDIDIARGTDGTMQNDAMKITASPLTITSGGTVDVPNFGLTITGGAGTINFATAGAVGDTATFEVRPVNLDSATVTVGGAAEAFPEFGCLILSEKDGDGSMFMVDAFKCRAAGLPIGFEKHAFSEAEVTAKLSYDSDKGGVYSISWVKPSV